MFDINFINLKSLSLSMPIYHKVAKRMHVIGCSGLRSFREICLEIKHVKPLDKIMNNDSVL